MQGAADSRGLYSLVDWNEIIKAGDYATSVEAYTASWIEISNIMRARYLSIVEAYTASWIEI